MNFNSKNRTSLTFCLILFELFLVFPDAALPEETRPAAHHLDRDFINTFALDLKGVLISPGEWDSKDIIWLSACLGTGVLIYSQDDEIQRWIRENKGSTSKAIAPYIRCFGKGGCLSLTLAAFYVTGELFHRKNLRETALMGLESWLISGAVVWSFKILAGRARPLVGNPSNSFRPFSFVSRYNSLPSGDASSAFAVATVIAEQSKSLCVDALVFSLAGLVALYRVHDDKHWLSDAFIGSTIGYVVAKKIVKLHRNGNESGIHLGILPLMGGSGVSLSLSF